MTRYYDLDLRQFVKAPGDSVVHGFDFKSRDQVPLRIVFCRGKETTPLQGSPVLIFAIKLSRSGPALAYADEWVEDDGAWTTILDLNTVPLVNAIGVSSQSKRTVLGEFYVTDDDGGPIRSYTIQVNLEGAVIDGTENTPADLPDPGNYYTKDQIDVFLETEVEGIVSDQLPEVLEDYLAENPQVLLADLRKLTFSQIPLADPPIPNAGPIAIIDQDYRFAMGPNAAFNRYARVSEIALAPLTLTAPPVNSTLLNVQLIGNGATDSNGAVPSLSWDASGAGFGDMFEIEGVFPRNGRWEITTNQFVGPSWTSLELPVTPNLVEVWYPIASANPHTGRPVILEGAYQVNTGTYGEYLQTARWGERQWIQVHPTANVWVELAIRRLSANQALHLEAAPLSTDTLIMSGGSSGGNGTYVKDPFNPISGYATWKNNTHWVFRNDDKFKLALLNQTTPVLAETAAYPSGPTAPWNNSYVGTINNTYVTVGASGQEATFNGNFWKQVGLPPEYIWKKLSLL